MEQEPKPVYTFTAVCATHDVTITVPHCNTLIQELAHHMKENEFTCTDVSMIMKQGNTVIISERIV